jgi:hypothetical protein
MLSFPAFFQIITFIGLVPAGAESAKINRSLSGWQKT